MDIYRHIMNIINITVVRVACHYLVDRRGSRHCPHTLILNITIKHHVLRLYDMVEQTRPLVLVMNVITKSALISTSPLA